MRKEYRKALRERFSAEVARRLPAFEQTKVESPLLFGGEMVYRRDADPGVAYFVLVVPDVKGRQAFTIELAWSEHGRFPDAASRPTHILGPDDPIPAGEPEGIIRLGGLVSPTDVWWSFPDPALEHPGDLAALQASLEPIDRDTASAHAEVPVAEAFAVLLEHGVPFFEDVAAERSRGSGG